MAPAIPDRWIPYKACGNVIEGTRFICFKVPLSIAVQTGNHHIKEIWDIKNLLKKIPNLGAVIDLTNTARYYNPKEFKDAGVLYKKIFIPGRIIPPKKIVSQFMNTVDGFLEKGCDTLIGVHCTHGLNRTGYMVCRYMRDRLGVDPEDAIQKFEKARGYKIERDNYIADILGHTPPPPFEGAHTNIKLVDDYDFTQNVECKEFSETGLTSEICTSSPGNYVRHPDVHQNRRRGRKRKHNEDGSENNLNLNVEMEKTINTEKESAGDDSYHKNENSGQVGEGHNYYKKPRHENYDGQHYTSNEYEQNNSIRHRIYQERAGDEINSNLGFGYQEQGSNNWNGNYENKYRKMNTGKNGRHGYVDKRYTNDTHEGYQEQGSNNWNGYYENKYRKIYTGKNGSHGFVDKRYKNDTYEGYQEHGSNNWNRNYENKYTKIYTKKNGRHGYVDKSYTNHTYEGYYEQGAHGRQRRGRGRGRGSGLLPLPLPR